MLTRTILLASAILACSLAPPPGAAQGEESAAAGLQSRLVAEKALVLQGDPIQVKVLARNATGKPVLYDAREVVYSEWGGWTLFEVLGPDGKAATPIYAPLQINSFYGQYNYPTLAPGDEFQADAAQLETYFYMRTPGKYRISWRGTQVWPRQMTAIGVLSKGERQGWEQPIREARKTAAPVPPPAAIEIEVAPAPGGGPDGDLVGRVLRVLPPGWQIAGAELLADKVVPPGGKQAGRGSMMTLIHTPHPDFVPNAAMMRLYVMAAPPAAGPAAADKSGAYLGKGKLGHVYLQRGPGPEFNAPLARWNRAAYDLAVALEVTDPAPAPPPPARPDWGRMVSAILADCLAEADKARALAYFCAVVNLRPAEGELASMEYECNLVPPTKAMPVARRDPETPYYRILLSVRPAAGESQLEMQNAEKSIRWDGATPTRGYAVRRIEVDIVITVLTDDQPLARALNAIFDRQVTAVLAQKM
ncbi:MAG: hypothetical protein NT049_12475 [Planctomycetota bacterium]|nr:hypothetical protein [Planctomycetota bacterium]